jgi:fumarate hydratase subunit beta
MDAYAPRLMDIGLKGMIGRARGSPSVIESMKKKHGGVLCLRRRRGARQLAESIKEAEVVAFPELGAEAIYKLRVENFPATVINDCYGNDLYEEGRAKYEKK